MCCFSGAVEQVSSTHIFARSANGRQFLAYSMTYAAAADLAMVLPLPVPPNLPEDAIRFINLEHYPTFFEDLERGFPPPPRDPEALSEFEDLMAEPMLQVHDVGSFEASFVPRLEDFDRLDERFRIPRDVWDRLPVYHDFGFAVFKLKGTGFPAKVDLDLSVTADRVHPMAFEFPRRDLDLLYFPTVHVHDRKVHADADFDHVLYCQPGPGMDGYLEGWRKSSGPTSKFMEVARTEGIVDALDHCWRRPLRGRRENKDMWVGKGGSVPAPSRKPDEKVSDPGEPIVKLLNMILVECIKKRARAIEFERCGTKCFVRFQVSETPSTAADVITPPLSVWPNLIARIKQLAGMVDDGPNKSMDGQIKVGLSDNQVETFYVTTDPTVSDDRLVVQIGRAGAGEL